MGGVVDERDFKRIFTMSIPGLKTIFFAVIAIYLSAGITGILFANDLDIVNGSIESKDTSGNTVVIEFDISWKNSWRDMTNYDAVWIFVKFSADEDSGWNHATLKGSGVTPDGFDAGTNTGIEIVVPSDGKGCFIQRSENGTGDIASEGVKIVWNYGYDGLLDEEVDNVGLKIFGIEMVYIPEGALYAGDHQTSTASFVQGSGDPDPWYIDDNSGISVENVASNSYYYVSGGNAGESATGSEFIIPASFAKGYTAFYIMKYEITEGQWVGFFNSLTDSQKINRDITGAGGKNSDGVVRRNTVSWSAASDAASLRPDRSCGYLSWMDLCAYADWAALRPMTELEYEKAARGKDILPVAGELPWGNTSVSAASNIAGDEDGSETLSNASANVNYNNVTFSGGDGGEGPLRAGMFATATSTRQQSGAGYYGVMELAGNVWERCVTAGNEEGRAFLSTHGDGNLTTEAGHEGNATNASWPGYQDGQGVSGASGSGYRGGSWFISTTNMLAVSNRSRAALSDNGRNNDSGGRCVRSAP